MVPKYMKNLHIAISSITGSPRIVSFDTEKVKDKPYFSTDKFIDIPKDEWDSALMSYFEHFEENCVQTAVGGHEGWSFFIGGHCKDKETLVHILLDKAQEIMTLPDPNDMQESAEENVVEEEEIDL